MWLNLIYQIRDDYYISIYRISKSSTVEMEIELRDHLTWLSIMNYEHFRVKRDNALSSLSLFIQIPYNLVTNIREREIGPERNPGDLCRAEKGRQHDDDNDDARKAASVKSGEDARKRERERGGGSDSCSVRVFINTESRPDLSSRASSSVFPFARHSHKGSRDTGHVLQMEEPKSVAAGDEKTLLFLRDFHLAMT